MAKTASRSRKMKPASRHSSGDSVHGDSALLQRNLPALMRSMTFARMVKENSRFLLAIKDLRWLFPPVCQRKDQAVLT